MLELVPLDPLVVLCLACHHVVSAMVLPIGLFRTRQEAELLLNDPAHLNLLHDLAGPVLGLLLDHFHQLSLNLIAAGDLLNKDVCADSDYLRRH